MDYFLSGIYMILLGRGIIFQAEGLFFSVEKGEQRTDIRSVGTTYPYTTVDPNGCALGFYVDLIILRNLEGQIYMPGYISVYFLRSLRQL